MSAGAALAILLGGLALVILGAVVIAAVVVAVIGPHRQSAMIGPTVAAAIGGAATLVIGSALGLDNALVVVGAALSATLVAVFQRLQELPKGTRGWTIGWLGGQASIGGALGVLIGAIASVIARDLALFPLLIAVGAVLRLGSAWAARTRTEPVIPTAPNELAWELAARPIDEPVIEEARQAEAGAEAATTREASLPVATTREASLPVATTREAPPSESPWGPVTILVAVGIVLLVAAVAFAAMTSRSGDMRLTVHNRTTVPIAVAGRAYYLPACTSVAFVEHSGVLTPEGSGARQGAIPTDAVSIDLVRLVPQPFEGPGPEAWELLITKDAERDGPPGSWSKEMPPCEGVPRQAIDLSGSGSTTLGPFRLSGFYTLRSVISASDSAACDFGARLRSVGSAAAAVELVRAFSVPAGGHPALSSNPTLDDAVYELDVDGGCSWEMSFEPS